MARSTAKECPTPNGTLLIIGGKEGKEVKEKEKGDELQIFPGTEILETFIKLTGKKNPTIEVITSASSEGDESFADYKKVFHHLGITSLGHIHHKERRDIVNEELIERTKKTDAFFFTGGDQLLLSSLYGGTPFLQFLKERYITDKVVLAGTSAGAMAMSTPMIYAGNKEVEQFGGEIKVTTGLEFLKDICIDTHFVHRGRYIRLAQVIATNPTCVGIGIEEDTAIIVRNGIEATVIGSGTIIVIEGFGITESSIEDFTKKKLITIRNLTTHILSDGDVYMLPQINPPHL